MPRSQSKVVGVYARTTSVPSGAVPYIMMWPPVCSPSRCSAEGSWKRSSTVSWEMMVLDWRGREICGSRGGGGNTMSGVPMAGARVVRNCASPVLDAMACASRAAGALACCATCGALQAVAMWHEGMPADMSSGRTECTYMTHRPLLHASAHACMHPPFGLGPPEQVVHLTHSRSPCLAWTLHPLSCLCSWMSGLCWRSLSCRPLRCVIGCRCSRAPSC